MQIIGIAGGTGSGKSTVVREITKIIPNNELAILPLDSYYKDNSHIPQSERKKINFDHPDAIEFELIIEHIQELQKGKSIELPVYSYITCERQKETITIEPRNVILVEGILTFVSSELRKILNTKIFVDCESDIRLSRIIMRDILERNRDVKETLQRYEKTVRPMHIEFIEPTKQFADIIIPQGGKNKVAIDLLTQFLTNYLT